jgi:hypothetical protein
LAVIFYSRKEITFDEIFIWNNQWI